MYDLNQKTTQRDVWMSLWATTSSEARDEIQNSNERYHMAFVVVANFLDEHELPVDAVFMFFSMSNHDDIDQCRFDADKYRSFLL